MLSDLLTRATAAERAVLADVDLGMWDYVILYALRAGPVASQGELAKATGRDKTRLIRHLDALEGRELIERRVDPGDRRHHAVALTESGGELVRRCHRRIREAESDVLGPLSASQAEEFLRLLEVLTRP